MAMGKFHLYHHRLLAKPNQKERKEEATGYDERIIDTNLRTSYADVVHENKNQIKVNFRLLETNLSNKEEGIDIVFPWLAVQESCKRFSKIVFEYFLGNRLPFPWSIAM